MLKLLRRAAIILFPPKCIFCGRLIEAGSEFDICGACYESLPFTDEVLIDIRSHDAEHAVFQGCESAVCVSRYTGSVKDSLIRFKFYNKPSYHRTYAKLLSARVRKLTDVKNFDMIMSIPLHRKKQRERGYNQAYLISKSLGRELGLPEMSYILQRSKYTDAQSLLDRSGRQKNVKDAFSVTDAKIVKDKRILLVDDILTTGFTLNECARTLKEAGACSITAAVVASGRSSLGAHSTGV